MRAANARTAPVTSIEPPKNCAQRYLKSPAPDGLGKLCERRARRAPAIGGPARIPDDVMSEGQKLFGLQDEPGAIAAVNIPVRVPISEGSCVIWATHELATLE